MIWMGVYWLACSVFGGILVCQEDGTFTLYDLLFALVAAWVILPIAILYRLQVCATKLNGIVLWRKK